MGTHRFYHVDRHKQLTEGQVVRLDDRGLSSFGACYWDAVSTKPFGELTDAEQREFLLEQIRCEPKFSQYTSRMQAFFGANTILDARRFYEKVEPKQATPVPIYEVYASNYWSLDMNWLDYTTDHEKRVRYLREYWYAAISNHNPESGERRLPLLEVLMALPVTIGKVVEWV